MSRRRRRGLVLSLELDELGELSAEISDGKRVQAGELPPLPADAIIRPKRQRAPQGRGNGQRLP